MRNPRKIRGENRPRRGFTLVELLVVILIIVLLAATTLPAILPALNSRKVSESSRILQAELSRARDLAIRNNAPAGFRLLPDPQDTSKPGTLTSSRFIALESAPDYIEGVTKSHFDPPLDYVNGTYPTAPNNAIWRYYAPPSGLPAFVSKGNWALFNDGDPNNPDPNSPPTAPAYFTYPYLIVRQDKAISLDTGGGTYLYLPQTPTSWFNNIRQGEKFRFNDSGAYYTIAGPVANPQVKVTAGSSISTIGSPAANPERFVSYGNGYATLVTPDLSGQNPQPYFEFLFLVNGQDDDFDGFIDEGFDGIDNDGDGITDPGFNGVDDDNDGFIDNVAELYLHRLGDGSIVYPGNPFGLSNGGLQRGINEFEPEKFLSRTGLRRLHPSTEYTIQRRPIVTPGARETSLPTGTVVDMTTFNAGFKKPERSRLPVDRFTGAVDVIVAPNGQIINSDGNANAGPPIDLPFFHFWIADRDDVFAPLFGLNSSGTPNPNPTKGVDYLLPMLDKTLSDPRSGGTATYPPSTTPLPTLKGERRLLSVNTRTGSITSTTIEQFAADNTSLPYEPAERGERDPQP